MKSMLNIYNAPLVDWYHVKYINRAFFGRWINYKVAHVRAIQGEKTNYLTTLN